MKSHDDLVSFVHDLAEGGVLFRLSDEGITRQCLRHLTGSSDFSGDLDELIQDFLIGTGGGWGFPSPPSDTESFCVWFRSTVLDLERQPREELVSVFQDARDDLQSITRNIAECKSKLASLKKKNRTEAGDSYHRKFYQYVQNINSEARMEILSFLEGDIYHYTLSRCYRPLLKSLGMLLRSPYGFRSYPIRYSIEYHSEVRNKFHTEPINVAYEWDRLYRDNSALFFERLPEYIADRDIIGRIEELLEQHHRLASRRTILAASLQMYRAHQHELWCSSIPLQIEGIFHDYCLELGIEDHELHRSSVSDKVTRIAAKTSYFSHYAYYAFRFPILRNLVAHGRLPASKIDDTSAILLLDLYDVARRMATDDLPINLTVKVLRDIQENGASLRDVLKFLSLKVVDVDPFYDLREPIKEITLILQGAAFWDELRGVVDRFKREDSISWGYENLIAGLRYLIVGLKSRKIQEARCVALLKHLGNTPHSVPDRSTFWHALDITKDLGRRVYGGDVSK